MHKSYTLMTFNIPIHLKSIFDELSSFKCVSKTSILNSLIENYCRQERQKLIQEIEFIENKSEKSQSESNLNLSVCLSASLFVCLPDWQLASS